MDASRWLKSGPLSAVAVTAAAVVAAVAGTAVAGSSATTAVSKKKVKKIATKQINKLAPGLSVANADTAERANTATQAQNAATANGVRPVKVNFAAPANTPERTFVNQGGVRIVGSCPVSGQAILNLHSTANNGLVRLDIVRADNSVLATGDLDFDSGSAQGANTGPASPVNLETVTVEFRGAGGRTVSGDLVLGQGTGAAQCVIAGTLFVG